MEIIFKEENGKLFGSTNIIGIGKRQPNLIYGIKAKEIREKYNLSKKELADSFGIRENIINKIENQSTALDEKICKLYCDRFNITKEYFFDLDLETLILSSDGHIIKSFDKSEDCIKKYNEIMEDYFNALENKDKYIIVDFN